MSSIQRIAVIGSGVMGAGIAALAANANVQTLLLDIVPTGAADRNQLAKQGVEKQLKQGGLVHPAKAQYLTAGNLEDDLAKLKDCDWIIEVVVEKLEVKQALYRKLEEVRKPGSIISSNTSTLPIHTLTEGFPESFKRDFLITHFFNPPRYMRLLEVVGSTQTRLEALDAISQFCDITLGKGIVPVKDTPGFIANRIGVYWLYLGLYEAIRLGLTVEEADAAMGKPLGIPKTGVFGLFDLIGLDLMPLIAKSMLATLPEDDAFRKLYQESPLLDRLIAEGYTGRKGKGGFYRMRKEGEQKIKEVLDLQTGEYRAEQKAALPAKDMKGLLAADAPAGQYTASVLAGTLHYAASLMPEIADRISDIDHAMQWGYSWQYGLFELADRIGADWFTQRWQDTPPIFAAAKGKPFYQAPNQEIGLDGHYHTIPQPAGLWLLEQEKRRQQPLKQNESAALWDMGDGIALLELSTKMHVFDDAVFDLIESLLGGLPKDFNGLVIGHDGEIFSAGANLQFMLDHAKSGDLDTVSHFIKRGQRVMMGLQAAPFPVVAALFGKALGGGCELVLHAHAVQAHMESYPGLVETAVGLVPAWGGSKEMLMRLGAERAFALIMPARTATSAEDAKDMGILRPTDGISMNRARVLADAKAKCSSLRGGNANAAIQLHTDSKLDVHVAGAPRHDESLSPHDQTIARHLRHILAATSAEDALEREHAAFIALIATVETQARIEHMLKTGRPLKN